ncbi:MAG TPA: SPASM domain-containing protein, partial [Candidatus Sulfotelmatobacter sp.]|nr:SPASM domain-containing protein [Candidatus Sulfotelmatobacter sp.]
SKNEPLLDSKLEERIAAFRRIAQPHQTVELVTNGALLDADRLRRLADAGTDLVTISLNAATAETFAKTNGGLSYERLVRNLESFRPEEMERVNLFVRYVRTKDNPGGERAFRKRWKSRGFNVFAFEVNNRAGAVRNYRDLLRAPTLAGRMRQLFRRWLSRRIFQVCPYVFSIANVMQNGDVVLCANDWHNREVLGNVRTQSLREIFNSPRLQEIRELMRQNRYDEIPSCRDCTLWKEANWL